MRPTLITTHALIGIRCNAYLNSIYASYNVYQFDAGSSNHMGDEDEELRPNEIPSLSMGDNGNFTQTLLGIAIPLACIDY